MTEIEFMRKGHSIKAVYDISNPKVLIYRDGEIIASVSTHIPTLATESFIVAIAKDNADTYSDLMEQRHEHHP